MLNSAGSKTGLLTGFGGSFAQMQDQMIRIEPEGRKSRLFRPANHAGK
jgi:hypothetical protein